MTPFACANCARTVREADAEDAGWRYWSDGVVELHLFCPVCGHREFRPDAPASAWLLTCGHELPLLEHERLDTPPERPRMCPACRVPRAVVVDR